MLKRPKPLAFHPERKCAKCANVEYTVIHVEDWKMLRKTCAICGYYWYEWTADR